MKRHNLHTHTTFSDGLLSPDQLVKTAKHRDLEILGISDHAFSTKLPEPMQITNCINLYLAQLRRVQQTSDNLDIKIGIEIDVSRIYGIKPSQLPFKVLNEFDYILFEYVNTENEDWGKIGGRDISEITHVRHKLKLPIGLAHNDLQQNYGGREEQIVTLLADYDIFIELCQSESRPWQKRLHRGVGRNTRDGLDYYQHFSQILIKELVSNEVKVVVGTDSHSGESLVQFDGVYAFIQKHNLYCHEIVL
ncbi:MAG: PHP domain-containing protein [Candidatus Hodarchaeota archaeon]